MKIFLTFFLFSKQKPESKFRLRYRWKRLFWYFNWSVKKHQNQTRMQFHFPSQSVNLAHLTVSSISGLQGKQLWKSTLTPNVWLHEMKETFVPPMYLEQQQIAIPNTKQDTKVFMINQRVLPLSHLPSHTVLGNNIKTSDFVKRKNTVTK